MEPNAPFELERFEHDPPEPTVLEPAASSGSSPRRRIAAVVVLTAVTVGALTLSIAGGAEQPAQSVSAAGTGATQDDASRRAASTPARVGLMLPDLQPMPPASLSVDVDPAELTRKIRFSTTTTNLGDGPLEMLGALNPDTGRTRATQRVVRRDGDGAVQRVVGEFIFHPTHRHWHFESFTEFALWTYRPGGALDRVIATTGKMTFCVMDTDRVDSPPPGASAEASYTGCGDRTQGISVGWQDTYGAGVPGQELDVTGVPDGRYAIRSLADPENRLMEKDDANNENVVYVDLSGATVQRDATPGRL